MSSPVCLGYSCLRIHCVHTIEHIKAPVSLRSSENTLRNKVETYRPNWTLFPLLAYGLFALEQPKVQTINTAAASRALDIHSFTLPVNAKPVSCATNIIGRMAKEITRNTYIYTV